MNEFLFEKRHKLEDTFAILYQQRRQIKLTFVHSTLKLFLGKLQTPFIENVCLYVWHVHKYQGKPNIEWQWYNRLQEASGPIVRVEV